MILFKEKDISENNKNYIMLFNVYILGIFLVLLSFFIYI